MKNSFAYGKMGKIYEKKIILKKKILEYSIASKVG